MKTVTYSSQNPPDALLKEVADLRELVNKKDTELADKNQTIEYKEQTIEQLLDYVQLLRQQRFGQRSEKANKDQINLFDESELEALLAELEAKAEEPLPDAQADTDTVTATQKQARKPVRRPLPANLKRVEKIIDVSDEDKQRMGDDWKLIGYDTSEQLSVIQKQYYVVLTKRAKYAPINDEVAGAEQGIKIAARPDQIIPKAIADASVIADVVTAKFVDGLPLYRQEKIYQREGIDLSRQTMSGWMLQLEDKLSLLMQQMKQVLYQGSVLHIDETHLQVLNEPDKENKQLSYMWVYKGGSLERPVIWFQYADSRAGQVPEGFLYPPDAPPPAHSLTLMTDGYAAYHALAKQSCIQLHAVCWAHARRKFIDASKGRKNTAAAHQMVALIGKLYHIERQAQDKTAEERTAIRQEYATLIIKKIKDWLDNKQGKVLPKSLLGKALHYTLNLWPQLTVYLKDGAIPIDNNAAENAIRPFVIGRKNWLFSGSPKGAHASATLYSLIESAKANDLEPRAYLTYVFEQLPKAKTKDAVAKLLPQNVKIPDVAQ